jgi:hypothetical protein
LVQSFLKLVSFISLLIHFLKMRELEYLLCNAQLNRFYLFEKCFFYCLILNFVLLATSWTHPTTRYIASDIDPKKCDFTKKNIKKSNLSNFVSVICCNVEGNLLSMETLIKVI